jgi:hypothetical protein
MDVARRRTLLFSQRELLGPAWVEPGGVVVAVLYDDQIAALAADEAATFSPTDAPGRAVAVRRTADAPVRWDHATSQVRFRVDDGGDAGAPRAGQAGWLDLGRKQREVLTVPAPAVRQSPEGPYVLMSPDGQRFERHPIEIGETFVNQGYAVVLSGLGVHERMVSRATFFLDADRRLSDASGGAAP